MTTDHHPKPLTMQIPTMGDVFSASLNPRIPADAAVCDQDGRPLILEYRTDPDGERRVIIRPAAATAEEVAG